MQETPIKICPQCGSEGHRLIGSGVGMIGGRDNFGIGRNFIDERTGKEITTWKEWEKAGYQKPEPKNHMVKEAMKEKVAKLKGVNQRQPKPHELPV
jgi:hypothetical protein